MKPIAKVLLAGCAVLVLLAVAGIAGVAWYVRAHKDDLLAQARKVRSDGAQAGRSLTEARCVDDALSRYVNDKGGIGGVPNQVWLRTPLEASHPPQGFFTVMPSQT